MEKWKMKKKKKRKRQKACRLYIIIDIDSNTCILNLTPHTGVSKLLFVVIL